VRHHLHPPQEYVLRACCFLASCWRWICPRLQLCSAVESAQLCSAVESARAAPPPLRETYAVVPHCDATQWRDSPPFTRLHCSLVKLCNAVNVPRRPELLQLLAPRGDITNAQSGAFTRKSIENFTDIANTINSVI